MPPVRRTISPHAAPLRRARTEAENHFWQAARNRGISGHKFRFQHSIGPYIADFACLEAMLIVEIDGSQHSPESDAARAAFLETEGFRILRFWNNEVLENLDGMLAVVSAALAGSCTLARKRERAKRGRVETEHHHDTVLGCLTRAILLEQLKSTALALTGWFNGNHSGARLTVGRA